ncbi:hypothetical protein AGLY_010947 [Aphis glycines]|uniref:Uncharacterized protein n=1 Tax=Aphis glycines TaxID=307491 RepID=A0A6G0TCY8_APHGL|nr:hypothetical protein AGLY_010947 [Aphis glycines]
MWTYLFCGSKFKRLYNFYHCHLQINFITRYTYIIFIDAIRGYLAPPKFLITTSNFYVVVGKVTHWSLISTDIDYVCIKNKRTFKQELLKIVRFYDFNQELFMRNLYKTIVIFENQSIFLTPKNVFQHNKKVHSLTHVSLIFLSYYYDYLLNLLVITILFIISTVVWHSILLYYHFARVVTITQNAFSNLSWYYSKLYCLPIILLLVSGDSKLVTAIIVVRRTRKSQLMTQTFLFFCFS